MLKIAYASTGLTLCGLVFLILVSFTFMQTNIAETFESKLFIILVYLCMLATFVEISYYILSITLGIDSHVASVVGRSNIIISIAFLIIFAMYLLAACFSKIINSSEKIQRIFTIIGILVMTALSLMSFQYGIRLMPNETGTTLVITDGVFNPVYISFGIVICFLIIAMIFKRDKMFLLSGVFIIISAAVLLFLNIINNGELICIKFIFSLATIILGLTYESTSNKLILKLEKVKSEAEKANASQTAFLQSMSHEIRTPLASIIGFGQSVIDKENFEDLDLTETAYGINTASNDLLELIDSIISVSNLQNNKDLLVPKYFNISTIIFDINNDIKPLVGAEVDFKVSINENIPSVFNGDQEKLTRSLKLILKNIIDKTNYGFIELSYNGGNSVSNEYTLNINFKCSGKGVYKPEYSILFEDYMANSNETTELTDKNTLGMIVAKKYIELMGGSFEFLSVAKEYAEIDINIPLEVVNPMRIGNILGDMDMNNINAPTTKEDTPEVQEVVKKKDLTGQRVLILDDYMLNIRLLKEILVKYNFEVDYCDDIQSALRKIKSKKYDYIFIDNDMPETPGNTALKEIIKNNKEESKYIITKEEKEKISSKTYDKKELLGIISKPYKEEEIDKLF